MKRPPSMQQRAPLAALAFAATWLALPMRPAEAGELQLNGAADATASTWRGDYGGGGELRLGYRFAKIVAVDFVGWEQYMGVDRRLNSGLTFGISGTIPLETVRPFARVFAIHQHEESLVSLEENAGGAVLGIGEGIRHRAGAGARLGVEIVLKRSQSVEWLALGGFNTTWFPDDALGPALYFSLCAGLGLNYDVPGLP